MIKPDGVEDARPSRADMEDVADAAIGVDTRIFRTLWDTLVHTPRVLEAAYSGDRARYVPIIRLFLVLFGLQFAIMAFLDIPIGMSVESLATSEATTIGVERWLAEAGTTRDAVNATLQTANGWTITLLSFLSSLPFLLIMKLYKLKRSFFGHALAYLVATNAAYIVILPFMLLGTIGYTLILFGLSFGLSMVMFYVALARIFARFYSQNPVVVTLQTGGLVLMLPVTLIIMVIGQFLIADLALNWAHDMSIFRLFALAAEATQESIAP
ncbi:MAG: hypothetical protein DHS20C06_20040 [Hyphobacterium sp.]|nr:MAG: hypothetical protein DHS20C06_20040 [Hyphobacterium sp.]